MDDFKSKYSLISKFIIGLILLAAIVFSIIYMVNQYIWSKKEEVAANALRAKKQNMENTQVDTTQMQDISFQQAKLVDTAAAIFIIPVSQVDANNDKRLVFTETTKATNYPFNNRKSFYKFSGSYNNLLIYTPSDSLRHFVFNKKVNINEFENELIGGVQYILIKATTEDSNKDDLLNSQDLMSFFIYDMSNEKLKEVSIPGLGLYDYQPITIGNQVLLRFVIDKNTDGYIDINKEPIIYKKLNVDTGELVDLVPDMTIQQLRNLINK